MSVLSQAVTVMHQLTMRLREWDAHTMDCKQCRDFDIVEMPRLPLNPPCIVGSRVLKTILDALNLGL